MSRTPIALTIAGSDSGGGAGIQADLKTMSALGVYGASVISALTAQNTLGVSAIQDVPIDFVTAQMQAVYSDLAVGSTKIGMLSQSKIIEAVATGLEIHKAGNIVLDPVMVATSGDLLLSKDAIQSLRTRLIPAADLITPNLYEAAVLLDTSLAANRGELENQAQQLLDMGANAVLLKGGHFDEPTADDLFVTKTSRRWYSASRIKTKNTHGTGCTLSSAIASGLAKNLPLETAIEQAKTYLSQAIAHADELTIGSGHGPVHHFFAVWGR